jgi:hypothetical protein
MGEKMSVDEEGKESERLNRLNRLYLAIIARYKDYIQEKEGLSVAELPTLVTPKDEAVAKKVSEIKSGFGIYEYDRDFRQAGSTAFSFVKDEIDGVILPLEFWLSPKDTLEYRMGDVIDKNILLCSMLVSLGNPSAKVLMRIKDESFSAFVYYEFENKIYMFDLGSDVKEFSGKEAMIASLGIDDDTTAYEFNNQTYFDIS